MAGPTVFVVHCIDTEGPLGGDARRLPDGSPEFMDNWADILATLRELTSDEFRESHRDSFGGPYLFNWFVLDFTGFDTNPKQRIAAYHDTWDHVTSLPVSGDGLYWHYHPPPASGVGDEWSDSWLTSNECNVILARRLLERGAFPAAFRAGGTIEDDAASLWLEHAIPLDFSNRVSERSQPGADLYHFNWYGAPAIWGSYHPSHASFLQPGEMRRFVYRSLDLRSRYNVVDERTAEECFRDAAATGEDRVLSFFSHDNRDMRPETYDIWEVLRDVSGRTGVPWRNCTSVEAHQRHHRLPTESLTLGLDFKAGHIRLATDGRPFQPAPFAAAELADGRFVRLFPKPDGPTSWILPVDLGQLVRFGAAVTSVSGEATVAVADVDPVTARLVPLTAASLVAASE